MLHCVHDISYIHINQTTNMHLTLKKLNNKQNSLTIVFVVNPTTNAPLSNNINPS